ncbi:MAG TPA: DUF5916 domain-containing protein [Gemmatimonadaceae bacterium]|nr:DUF5916 domain-containing protein [Gemmatimonadaceae bacterium]
MRTIALLAALLLSSRAAAQAATASHSTTRAAASGSGSAAVKQLHAAHLTGTLTIDGHLNEPAWQTADSATGFTQSYPNPGQRPTQRTVARILFDDAALYVGVRLYDAHPDSIAAQLGRRDATSIYSDWVHVMIDSYHDRRTAFRFSVNPRGVMKDAMHSNDVNEDASWDAVWQAATAMDDSGWTVELRIPLSQLRFGAVAPGSERVWGLGLQRDIARNQERDAWTPWTRNDAGFVSFFGDLVGIDDLRVPARLEIQPYVSTSLTRAPGSTDNPFFDASDYAAKVGADLKYGLPKGFTLTATVNPDFGQVEVDPAVVNLSAFETFFPEKRPFFLEGADMFDFGRINTYNNYQFQQFFYTRRIGRAPQLSAAGGDAQFVDQPDETTILGAAKVSGKTAGWTLGLLDAVTAEEKARVATTGGDELTTPVEPMTNYFVGRVRRDLRGGQTVVGAMITSANRKLSDPVFAPVLRSGALFGGVDFEHSWNRHTWSLTGYVSGSRVEGSPAAITATQQSSARYYQRPDADYLGVDPTRRTLGGHMAELALDRSGNWDMSLGYKEASPGFEINDLGFESRADYRAVSWFAGQRVTHSGRIFRDYSYYGYGNLVWNFGGDRTFEGYGVGANGTFKNLWYAGVSGNVSPDYVSDRLTRGGPLALVPASWSASVNGGSDSRKMLSTSGFVSVARDVAGGWSRSANVSLSLRPSSSLLFTTGPSLSRLLETEQYLTTVPDPLAAATFGQRFVFGNVKQTTLSLDTRVDWTFTPTLSLQLFAQPFIASGSFSSLKELSRGGSRDFAFYGVDRGSIHRGASCDAPDASGDSFLVFPDGEGGAAGCFEVPNPDFNIRSLRGNAVLRWEYRPGSTLFFVWQQERSAFAPVGDFAFGRDAHELFRAPARNIFLIKLSYWVGR